MVDLTPESSFSEAEVEAMEPITRRIIEFWNNRTDTQRDSLSPILLSGAASLMVAKGNTAVKLGGASLLGIGLNWIAHNAAHRETNGEGGEKTVQNGYDDLLGRIPGIRNPTTLSGLFGLASCAFLGGNAVNNLIKGKGLDANALLVFANFGPWLVTNLSSFFSGLKQAGDVVIQEGPDIEVATVTKDQKERAVFGITPSSDAKLSLIGSLCVLGFGLSKGFTDTIIGGAAMSAADYLRLFRANREVRRDTAHTMNDIERFLCKELPQGVQSLIAGIGRSRSDASHAIA